MKKMIAVAIAFALGGCNCPYSDGMRVGTVTKISKKGLICKTWEGEMFLGGVRNKHDSDGRSFAVANTWEFTVRDENSLGILLRAAETGERVKVQYDEVAFRNPCASERGYFVRSVELLP